MFTVYVEDQTRKKESASSRGTLYVFTAFFLEGSDRSAVYEFQMTYSFFVERFLAAAAPSEFFTIYTAMYLLHWFSLYFFFFFMIGGCFSIVAVLDLNKVSKLRSEAANSVGQMTSAGTALRGATKLGFFSAMNYGVTAKAKQ